MRPEQTLARLNQALWEAYELLGGSVLERYLALSLEALNAHNMGFDEACKRGKTIQECYTGCLENLRKIDNIIRERKKLIAHIVGE